MGRAGFEAVFGGGDEVGVARGEGFVVEGGGCVGEQAVFDVDDLALGIEGVGLGEEVVVAGRVAEGDGGFGGVDEPVAEREAEARLLAVMPSVLPA